MFSKRGFLRANPYACIQPFCAYLNSFRPISPDTCARWLRTVLSLSRVDVSIIKAHSFRTASSSKAASLEISIDHMLKTADWSNENIFTRFYLRDVLPVQRLFSYVILQETYYFNKFVNIAMFVALNMHNESRSVT